MKEKHADDTNDKQIIFMDQGTWYTVDLHYYTRPSMFCELNFSRYYTREDKNMSKLNKNDNSWNSPLLLEVFLLIQGGPEITERHTSGNNCKS